MLMGDESKSLESTTEGEEHDEEEIKKQLEKRKLKYMNKSIYQLAAEMQNETMAPSIDSYGESNVFLRYKQNKWFEAVNIIQLKREQAVQNAEFLKALHEQELRAQRKAQLRKKQEEME